MCVLHRPRWAVRIYSRPQKAGRNPQRTNSGCKADTYGHPTNLASMGKIAAKTPRQGASRLCGRRHKVRLRIGVDPTRGFMSAKQNMASANMNPTIIEDYIQKEKEAGRLLGPFTGETTPTVHINRIGVIPKKRQPNKWRLITDLSHPEGSSVNDAISKDQCTLSYITVDEVATAAMALGAGALLAKIDIQAAGLEALPLCCRTTTLIPMQTLTHHLFHLVYCSCCWTPAWTGHRQPGPDSSILLFSGSSSIDTSHLPV